MKAIVDCNSFYCSCERLFRPDLLTRPVAVLSNNDGCIISRSDEACRLDLRMGVPYFQARHIIQQNGIAVFSSNYHLYGDMSWRVMETLRIIMGEKDRAMPCAHRDSNRVEVYSVDEAFLDLSHIPAGELEEFARHIKATVEQWTGISVSIGIAPTKTLAKMANRLAKKDKKGSGCIRLLVTEEDQGNALRETRVDDLWGVGRAYAVKLINWGITSAWELRNMSEEWAHRNMGGVVGVRLVRELSGQPSIDMEEELTTKKMIATTRMFGRPVTSVEELKEAVATYISRAAEKLRRQNCAAGVVSVFIVPRELDHQADFRHGPSVSGYTTLPSPTSLTHELIKPAVERVDQLFEQGRSYKKAGVMLSGLVPDSSIQGNLFVPAVENQQRSLMQTIDNINFAMRDDTVKFGSAGMNKNWKMRQELRSGRHSTRWEDLKEVK